MSSQQHSSSFKKGKTTTRSTNAMLIVAGVASLLFASCSKNQDIQGPSPVNASNLSATIIDGDPAVSITGPNASGTISNTGGVYQVTNFRQSYASGPGQPAAATFYWRFQVNEAGASPSDSMDIKFSGIATGDISTFSQLTSQLRFVSNTTFDAVTASDWTSATIPASNTIGMDSVTAGAPAAVAAYANHLGWYIYQWSDHTVRPLSNRVLLWKKGTVIYKFQIESIYLDSNITGGQFPYFTFRYKKIA